MAEEVKEVENTTENVETQTTEQTEVKTFTQEEVNAIVKDRLDRDRKNQPSPEELEAFNQWKESQKTEAEKALEKDKEIEQLKQELTGVRNENIVRDANVDEKYRRFVISEISLRSGDFKENLESYLKENPQYLIQDKKPVTTGISQNTTNKALSEEKAYLDKKYANNPYYKP